MSPAIEMLHLAKEVIGEGGDKNPCERGPFCLRCCLALAKGKYDDKYGSGVLLMECFAQVASDRIRESVGDEPLVDARTLVAKYDNGVTHTKESATALIDVIIAENA